MSIAVALNNALSGIAASQQGLAVISQNVANANTEGYTRKIANQSTTIVAGRGSGVRIDDITRLVDGFLAAEVRTATSEDGRAKALAQVHELAQNMFGAPGNNLSVADDLARFNSALEALANNPENAGLRLNAINEAKRLAENIRDIANSAQSIRREADQQLSASVERANELILRIDEFNDQISRSVANNLPTVDLEDQRDLAMLQLAEEIDIQSFTRADGRISVLTGSGVELVGDEATRILYSPASSVEAATVFGEIRVVPIDSRGNIIGSGNEVASSGVSAAVTTTITGGRIAGLLQARDEDITNFAAQVEAFATKLRDETNALHNQGTAAPPPNDLTGTRVVAGTDAFQATGTVRIAVTDSTGALVDVVDINLTTLGAVTVNDVVSAINTGLSGNGTASIDADGHLTISADSSANGIAINDIGTEENVTDRGFSHYFGLNDLFVGTTAADFEVNPDIAGDPARFATAQLSTTATVGQSGVGVGDNRNIQALAGLSTAAFDFTAVGGLGAQRSSLGDYASIIISLSAARASAATDSAEQKVLILENVQNRLNSQTGVNVDEELATMVVFQNAFVMAARVLKAASEMLDTLNSMIR